MGNANAAKAAQLGMPLGTARNKLVRMIMFEMAQELGRDSCYRCGLKIETEPELSIEHKEFWLHVSPDLFWDLRNIAFSHKVCNKVDRPYLAAEKQRKIGPDGTSWCYYGKHFVDVSLFDKGPRFNGLAIRCKSCNNQSKKDYKVDRKKFNHVEDSVRAARSASETPGLDQGARSE